MPVLNPDQTADFTVAFVAGGAGGIGTTLGASDITMYLPSGVGNGRPYPNTANGPFWMTLGDDSTTSGSEIVKCTARSGDTCTIVRNQGGTNQAWVVGIPCRNTFSSINVKNLYTLLGYALDYNVKNYGAVGNGSTDDSGAINAAISAASAAGGGTVVIPGGSTYAIANPIVPMSNVNVRMDGATLLWTGGTSSYLVQSLSTTVLQNMVWQGGTLNANNATSVGGMFLQSPQVCRVRDLQINNVTTTGTVALRIEGSGSNGPSGIYLNNAGVCVFDNITIDIAPIGVQLSGTATGTTVATNMSFYGLKMGGITQTGIRFVTHTDSCEFYGTWISLQGNLGTTGVIFNDSATPSANVGVYAHYFSGLSIDTFNSPTSATGIVFNNAGLIHIDGAEIGPQTAGVTDITDNYGTSYQVELTDGSLGIPPHFRRKNWRINAVGTAPGLGSLQTGISSQSLTPSGYPAPCDDMGVLHIVTTGSAPGAGATVAIITFATAFTSTPVVIIADQTSSGTQIFAATASTTTLTIRCITALANTTTYNVAWYMRGI